MSKTKVTSYQKYDAIIVLAAGVNRDGTLPQIPKIRVEKAVELVHQNVADIIIMSGRYSMLIDNPPAFTEARAMKELALSVGVIKPGAIFEEDTSMDTLGNAYFTYVNYVEPQKWQSVLVITSDYHVNRSRYLFEKVYGDKCHVDFMATDDMYSESEAADKEALENKILNFYKKILDHIKDGDTNKIHKVLMLFPGYSHTPKYVSKFLLNHFHLQHYENHEPGSGDS